MYTSTSIYILPESRYKRLNHFVAPTIVEDKPEIIIIHVGCNCVTKQNINRNPNKVADCIISIRKLCASNGVERHHVINIF